MPDGKRFNHTIVMLTDERNNLVKRFETSFREHWDMPAVTDWGTDKTLTYGQLATVIAHLHVMFEENGLQKEDKVALMGRNNSCWVATFLATITYGAIVVPILQDFKAADAIHITPMPNCCSSAIIYGRALTSTRYLTSKWLFRSTIGTRSLSRWR